MIREAIKKAIEEALPGVAFVVERPRDMSHGDYSTNAALVAKVDPTELAAKLKIDGIECVEVVGRFINFYLTREALMPRAEPLPQAHAGKKIMVDYTQPNPFKPFHIGHLMSNTIGEAIARLFEATGATVLRVNYQGDVGPHVAKAIWGIRKLAANPSDIDAIGKAYVLGTEAYETDPAAKAEIDELNKKIYEHSDPAVDALYDAGRAASLGHFEELYKILGTKFDEYYFESQSWKLGLEIVRAHMGDVFEESDGAIIFRGEKYGLNTRVFVTSQGLPTYDGKEIGLIRLKFEQHHPDRSIVVTAIEQNNMFAVAFVAAEMIDPALRGKLEHVSHGMMRFASGKMSSRKGNIVTGESLLNDMIAAAKEKMGARALRDADTVARQVAVGAIKYAVLKQGRGKDIIFDSEKSLSLEGDSGPYLQYALVRARSLLRAAREAGVAAGTTDAPGHADILERVLVHYSDALARAAKELEPHYLTTYVTELAGAFNAWYASNRVLGGEHPHFGVLIAQTVEQVLSQGLNALGIPTPKEM